MTDYTTLAVVKSRLAITDTQHDSDLAALITAASRAIDRWCKRADNGFVGTTETRVYDVPLTVAGPLATVPRGDFGGGNEMVAVPSRYHQILDIDPLLTLTSLATDEDGDGTYEQSWQATDYTLLPINAALDARPYRQIRPAEQSTLRFPIGRSRVQIVGSWGVAASVPPVIQEAANIVVARLFKRREAPFGVTQDMGAGSTRLPAKDPDVDQMLCEAGYVDHWFFS